MSGEIAIADWDKATQFYEQAHDLREKMMEAAWLAGHYLMQLRDRLSTGPQGGRPPANKLSGASDSFSAEVERRGMKRSTVYELIKIAEHHSPEDVLQFESRRAALKAIPKPPKPPKAPPPPKPETVPLGDDVKLPSQQEEVESSTTPAQASDSEGEKRSPPDDVTPPLEVPPKVRSLLTRAERAAEKKVAKLEAREGETELMHEYREWADVAADQAEEMQGVILELRARLPDDDTTVDDAIAHYSDQLEAEQVAHAATKRDRDEWKRRALEAEKRSEYNSTWAKSVESGLMRL